jgi:hypothetical protein
MPKLDREHLQAVKHPTTPCAEIWRLAVHRHCNLDLLDSHVEGIVPQVAVALYIGHHTLSMPSEAQVGLRCTEEQRLVRHAVRAFAQKLELY